MKKIGIVGGAAWQSTLEYYRLICAGSNDHHRALGATAPLPTPRMAIESLNMAQTRALRAPPGSGEDGWAGFDAVIRDALLRLQGAGCDFAIIANNTMHTRLHSVTRGVAMPVLSILDAVADATRQAGAGRALVLGTPVTMRADDYAQVLAARGITATRRPDDAVIDHLQVMIDTDFYTTDVAPEGRARLLALCRDLVEDPSETAVLLACTELPLAFREHAGKGVFQAQGFTFVDTVAVHARAALNRALGIDDQGTPGGVDA